jgi:hypothetical protein
MQRRKIGSSPLALVALYGVLQPPWSISAHRSSQADWIVHVSDTGWDRSCLFEGGTACGCISSGRAC